MAYESDETGRNEVYLRPFPETETVKWLVSTEGGVMPVWARSGRELFYVNADREMVVARIGAGSDFAVADRTVMFTVDPDLLIPQNEQYALYDVTPDGQRFLMLREVSREDSPLQLIVVENFFEELKAKAGN